MIGAGVLVVLLAWLGARARTNNEVEPMRATLDPVVTARVDPALTATVGASTPLYYAAGPSERDDVPGHVRAGSALRWHGEQLVIVQDDVNALALRDGDGRTQRVLLPAGARGRRVFDDIRGNKEVKLDLEAAALLADGRLVAFGSGSNPHRENLALRWPNGRVEQRHVPDFYEALRDELTFAGSELNVEGALVVGDELLLFQRGNGAARDGRRAVNAIGRVDLDEFVRWLDTGGATPRLTRITPVELGTLSGVALGFTDAALAEDGRVAVIACAEDSADAVTDGPVLGCRFGWLTEGALRMTDVLTEDGSIAPLKLEGIERRSASTGTGEGRSRDDLSEFDVVADMDRPSEPARLVHLRVAGR